MNHKFSERKETGQGKGYFKCLRCEKVMFEYGDSYFNTVCQEATKEQENLRQILERL